MRITAEVTRNADFFGGRPSFPSGRDFLALRMFVRQAVELVESIYRSDQWRRVCDVSSQLLDSPAGDWEDILARECGGDVELRACVLSVCGGYSETDELFGVAVHSPLALEDSLIGQRIGR